MLIGITGGIGSGKSVVSRILHCMGYAVYDSDTQAKDIMDADEGLKKRLATHIHPEAIDIEGNINRKLIASIVFSDREKLRVLNTLVHSSVREDLALWKANNETGAKPVFVECAIIYTSGIAGLCDCIWEVTASEDIRINRIMTRNGLSAEDAIKRIAAQRDECLSAERAHVIIENNGIRPLLPQIETLLAAI